MVLIYVSIFVCGILLCKYIVVVVIILIYGFIYESIFVCFYV